MCSGHSDITMAEPRWGRLEEAAPPQCALGQRAQLLAEAPLTGPSDAPAKAMAVITLLVLLLKSIIQHTQPVGDEVDEAVGEDMQQRAAQPSQEMMQLLQEVKEPEQRSPEQSGFGWPALLFAAWQQWQFWATAGLLALLFGLCWWLRKRSPEVDSSGKEESSSRDTEQEEEQPPIGVGSTFEGWSPCEDDAVYCLLVPPRGHAFHLELGTPGEMPAKMQQMELPRKHAAVQFLGCRECLSSSDTICVRWDQVDDLLSLVAELRAEVKRLRSIRECEMEIDRKLDYVCNWSAMSTAKEKVFTPNKLKLKELKE
ncbi:uncharacterized protein LOC141928916 [Strix aluco]|uniref:uncharacterized protein LOC141928916 n=1 Tax=Strix aluco TaxID=111821 RepID=UPI003DA60F7D